MSERVFMTKKEAKKSVPTGKDSTSVGARSGREPLLAGRALKENKAESKMREQRTGREVEGIGVARRLPTCH